jgi:hemolysin III
MTKESLGELIANAISHGIGTCLAITALVLMMVQSNTTMEYVASLVYGISLIILYSSSTLFHSFPQKMKRVLSVFQRLDHTSIFLLISGTYTPFMLLIVQTTKGYVLLVILWLITIIAITLKAIWIHRYHALFVTLYVVMGWSVLLVMGDVLNGLEQGISLLFIGGISYTLGVIFYASRFKYHHFIWHLFVLAGSICHFLAIYIGILL